MLRNLRNTVLKTVGAGVSVVALAEVTTHLPSEGRSSEVYHKLCDFTVRQVIQKWFSEENAHLFAIKAIQHGWAPKYRHFSRNTYAVVDTRIKPFSSPLVFPSPIGAAAGLDKDGVAISGLLDMGFGFVEIGSVTPLPQPGNPLPRIFRLTEDRAIINRCGFNSMGVNVVQENLKAFRSPTKTAATTTTSTITAQNDTIKSMIMQRGKDVNQLLRKYVLKNGKQKHAGIVGLNVGRNKETQDEIEDYKTVIRELGTFVDYIVINISSPNTPGLRDSLQKKDKLEKLLIACLKERDALANSSLTEKKLTPPPLLVKISPDLTNEEMVDIANVITSKQCKIDGLVISNTTTSRPLLSSSSSHQDQQYKQQLQQSGGLSGVPLFQKSTECIRTMYALTDGNVPIIGVGGVTNGQDAYEKLCAGASLVQIYTAMTYEGAGVVSRIRNELNDILYMDGHKCVQDAVGSHHENIYWRKKKEELQGVDQ